MSTDTADDMRPTMLDTFPLLAREDRAKEFHTFDLADDADMAKAVLLGRYENTVRDLESRVVRAEAVASAYQRGWKLIGGDWYDDTARKSGVHQCADENLVSHLASLTADTEQHNAR